VGHASRSTDLLRVEGSQARISQSGLKTCGGTARMVNVASSRMLCRVEAQDRRGDAMGCIGPFYPNFAIFIVLGPSGVLVFYLGL
jgi:hypothetical protein